MQWYLNGEEIETLGLRILGGEFRSHGASTLRLGTAEDFDGGALFAYGDEVALSYVDGEEDEVIYFQGKCSTIPRYASGGDEGMEFIITDAWEELERTIYQESWGYGVIEDEEELVHVRADRHVPRAVFGMDATGARISVGTQIANAISYAASAGVAIQAGSIPTGEIPVQSQLENVSVAEVISMCLKFHPDWMPVIDHATSPPTLNVIPVSEAATTTLSLATSGVSNLNVVERTDLIPDAVRIIYEFAGEANVEGDPEIFRKSIIDKYPTDGPDAGPGVLVSVVPLQGQQMQAQKSRLHCRTIPTSSSHSQVKAYLKRKYIHLANVPDAEMTVTGWEREMLPDTDDDLPDPINPRAVRLDTSDDLSKYPRELVRGSVEDWMRVRIGKMKISPTVTAAGGASADTIAAIAKGTPPFSVVATNARNKTYHGSTQWTPPEDVPSGIAASVYASILAGVRWQGSLSLAEDEVPLVSPVGSKLDLTGSALTALSTMGAPVHAMSFDVERGQSSMSFGPVPYLAPTDFLELQRILRSLPVRWWSTAERTSDKIGAQDDPSAAGDTVGSFDLPETQFEPSGGGGGLEGAFFSLAAGSGGHTYLQGGTVTGAAGSTRTVAAIKVIDASTGPVATSGHHLWIEATVSGIVADGLLLGGVTVTNATTSTGASVPANTAPTVSAATGKKCYVSLGVFTDSGFNPANLGNVQISFCPPSTYTVTRD